MQFYQHDIPAWMDGTGALTDGQYRAYHVICQLCYQREEPIVNNEIGIAGLCKQRLDFYRANVKALVALGKLQLVEGKLWNPRVQDEIDRVNESRKEKQKSGAEGGRKSGEARRKKAAGTRPSEGGVSVESGLSGGGVPVESGLSGGGVQVESGSSEGRVENKVLNLFGSDEAPLQNPRSLKTRQDKTIQDSSSFPNGKASHDASAGAKNQAQPAPEPPAPPTPDAELYRRGKEVLGKNAGGLITDLKKHHGGNVALARATIEQASTKSDPREYIGRVIAGRRETQFPGGLPYDPGM